MSDLTIGRDCPGMDHYIRGGRTVHCTLCGQTWKHKLKLPDHREAPAPTLVERVTDWLERPWRRPVHLSADALLRECLTALAERAEGSEGEPVAWLREMWFPSHQRWSFAGLCSVEPLPESGIRLTPLYRKAERAEPDGALREALEGIAVALDGIAGRVDYEGAHAEARELGVQVEALRALASTSQRAGRVINNALLKRLKIAIRRSYDFGHSHVHVLPVDAEDIERLLEDLSDA